MVVRLLALRTGRLFPPENIPGTHNCQRLSRSQGHSEDGRLYEKVQIYESPQNSRRRMVT